MNKGFSPQTVTVISGMRLDASDLCLKKKKTGTPIYCYGNIIISHADTAGRNMTRFINLLILIYIFYRGKRTKPFFFGSDLISPKQRRHQ